MELKMNKKSQKKSAKTNHTVLTISLTLTMLFLGLMNVNAQEAEKATDTYKAFDAGLRVKNMHLWHGFVVHPGAMIATNLDFYSRDKKFNFGVWGGASFSGTDVTNQTTGETVSSHYKEFSIYTSYKFSDKFFIEAVSHNNYTGVEERGDDLHYWSYDITQGYNFVDVNFGYNITPNTLLYLATIIGGGSGDYEVKDDGSTENSWTHYFEVKSKVWERENTSLSVFAGGAWSFLTDKTFYTNNSGNLINVGATLSKQINVGNFKLPVDVTAMWNPEQEKTVLQVDLVIF
ncbi:hypothetical protein FHR24_002902 [Wenyingzhuangia heitensis]|uniref:Uncharacterized protein n=1 Tax=Wenyingzhuangia heitensis TaxID=1487859 RepID=A0ABX0UEW2_9FLAO|nr:hypothetical protein [Wenyingzhuangia heitensis]NIJ46415.1 hypothetical protein [Wenyingzhuangia heitensis]